MQIGEMSRGGGRRIVFVKNSGREKRMIGVGKRCAVLKSKTGSDLKSAIGLTSGEGWMTRGARRR
jgi:hypothetical protein